MEVQVLGPLLVVDDGREVPLGPKERVLLARLVAARGQNVSVDALVDVLWGDHPPATARKTLQGYVHRLRRAMGPDSITSGEGTYRLDGSVGVDIDRVESLIDDGRQAVLERRADDAARSFDDARAAFRGRPLGELEDDPTSVGLRQYLVEMELALDEDRLRNELARGRAAVVVGETERLVARDPTRERAWCLLVTALAGQGRQGEALDAVARARRALAIELGLEPSANLKELEQAILDQRELPWSPPTTSAIEPFQRAAGPPAPTATDELEPMRSPRWPDTSRSRWLISGALLLVLAGVGLVIAVLLVDTWGRDEVGGGQSEASPTTTEGGAPTTSATTAPSTSAPPATTDPPAPTTSSTTLPPNGRELFIADYAQLPYGSCLFRLPALPGQGDLERRIFDVDCSQPHQVEYLLLIKLGEPEQPYPGAAVITAISYPACKLAFAAYVGVPYEQSGLEYAVIDPSELGWAEGRRHSSCFLTSSQFDQLFEQSMQGSRL